MVSMFKRRGVGKWVLSWRDSAGRRREKVAFRSKKLSEQLRAKIEREIAMGQAGMLDPYEAHRKAELEQHLADFEAMLESRSPTKKYVTMLLARLRRAFREMGALRLADLRQADADKFLRDLRKKHAMAARTRDAYAAALYRFGEWLADDERLPLNPFRRCKPTAKEADATFERMPLTFEQLRLVCEAAPVRSEQEYARTHPKAKQEALDRYRRFGERRAVLYWFAAYTGLRANECRHVRWADLDLDGEVPNVLVRARGREESQGPARAAACRPGRAAARRAQAHGRRSRPARAGVGVCAQRSAVDRDAASLRR